MRKYLLIFYIMFFKISTFLYSSPTDGMGIANVTATVIRKPLELSVVNSEINHTALAGVQTTFSGSIGLLIMGSGTRGDPQTNVYVRTQKITLFRNINNEAKGSKLIIEPITPNISVEEGPLMITSVVAVTSDIETRVDLPYIVEYKGEEVGTYTANLSIQVDYN